MKSQPLHRDKTDKRSLKGLEYKLSLEKGKRKRKKKKEKKRKKEKGRKVRGSVLWIKCNFI